MKIAVGSTNPIKLTAALQGFQTVWPEERWDVEGINVLSGVSEQPLFDEETVRGAITRAEAVMTEDTDYGVGIEGGIQQIDDRWFSCGWVAIVNQQHETGLASSERIMLPDQIMNLVKSGMSLGAADDKVFVVDNSSQEQGNFGLMTKGQITRLQAYTHAVICALARFIQPQLF